MGRAGAAAGLTEAARVAYERAAEHPTVFYGQLALRELGRQELVLPPGPAVTATDRLAFDTRPIAQAIRVLAELGEIRLATVLLIELANQVQTATALALTIQLAEEVSLPHVANLAGRIGAKRDISVHGEGFVMSGLPELAREAGRVEPALVFGLSRQESGFNFAVVSSAGARGLMQLMPATARAVARDHGEEFDAQRLTQDPVYNVTLGRAHLGDLLDKFNGSYIMTFGAYNAGASRIDQWMAAFGDPRDASVDPIDWVEQIPFTETRSYVKWVLGNTQVYRAIMAGGRTPLQIWEDLTRGR
jgi:soluble lytic murein transglycosylase